MGAYVQRGLAPLLPHLTAASHSSSAYSTERSATRAPAATFWAGADAPACTRR